MRSKKSERQNQNANHARPLVLGSDMPGKIDRVSARMDCELYGYAAEGVSSDAADILSSGPESATPSVTRSNAKSQAPLLQTLRFFHSHTAKPMALEQVYAEEDSEDEIDDDVADLEDRRKLDEFVDVSQHDKPMMHLWNSFKRRQRCWKLFMIKLWNDVGRWRHNHRRRGHQTLQSRRKHTLYVTISGTIHLSDSEHILSQLSEEEQEAAEESFSVYFRPVEFYDILQSRANENPSFLTKCLHYKLKDKHKRRVQLSVSIRRPLGDGQQTLSNFSLYILLARPVPTPSGETMQSSCYRFKRACKVTASNGALTVGSPLARFILPDINKLSTEFKSGSLAILLVHFADLTNQTEIDLTKDHMLSPSTECYCLMGKAPIDFIHFSRENSPKISLGGRAEFISTVSLKSCYMKLSSSGGEKRLSFHFPYSFEVVQVPITITAEELGAKDISPLDLPSYKKSTDKLPEVPRPRTGEVIFNFKYYDNMLQKTEVTEGYTCPFCHLKCASYKGLVSHLPASHDLFNYEFWGEGDYQIVNVSAKITASSSEIVGKVINRREKEFYFCHSHMRRRKSERQNQNTNHAGPLVLESNMPVVSERMDCEIYSPREGVSSAAADIIFSGPEPAFPSIPGSSSAPTTLRRLARSRKLSNEGYNARNQSPLQMRRFFHARTAQPMALEQVYAEEDSEDEVDDDVADLEDRRKLDEFVDVSQHNKRMMHLWNSFKRKQRVLADAHMPWACEAFSTHHREDLVHSPQLFWYWKLFMVKLWNDGLIDAKTMDNCHSILNRNGDQNPENKN
ncbi:hypothetical protein L1987_35368 [Smallanthus sonchifolius]|uniref:Uncharacterized protein n=1 Tax=Smallanthus sonchifolius TaxID=185202 RepID=A0ACB9HX61_9ASTR|nr:hypothetical protein L1987_35368 [Smallanthus sonchifolius]